MKKKVIYKIIVALVISLIVIILTSNLVFARTIDTNINISKNLINDFQEPGNRVIGALKVIGTFIAVAMAMVVGIKYMLSSVEAKAEYKKTAIAYLIGALLIFATPQIIDFIYNILN